MGVLKCSYKGQVDQENQPCGFGEATSLTTGMKNSCTWFDGKVHGLCKYNDILIRVI